VVDLVEDSELSSCKCCSGCATQEASLSLTTVLAKCWIAWTATVAVPLASFLGGARYDQVTTGRGPGDGKPRPAGTREKDRTHARTHGFISSAEKSEFLCKKFLIGVFSGVRQLRI